MKTEAAVKHTPGPWQIDRSCAYYPQPVIRHNGWITAVLHDNGVGFVHPEHARAEDESNANLIAAAPELLEALEYAANLVRVARQYFPKSVSNSDKFELENTCAAIGNAIRKARGE